jgi:predicted DNA-binding antitoxin AbrB/MazE fold protein
MPQVEAIFQGGVFKPLTAVSLEENQRVRLTIQPLQTADIGAWLQEVQGLQQQVRTRSGDLPDSTPDIAADRGRDE